MNPHRPFLLVALLLCLALSACTQTPPAPPAEGVSAEPASAEALEMYLIRESVALTGLMDSLGESEDFMRLNTVSQGIADLVAAIAAEDYATPRAAAVFTVPDASVEAALLALTADSGSVTLPDNIREQVITRMLRVVPTQLSATQGTEMLAAVSLLTVQKAARAHEAFTDNTYVLLSYGDFSSITVFRKPIDGIVTVSSQFARLPDELETAIAEQTAADYWADAYGLSGIDVRYLSAEELAAYR